MFVRTHKGWYVAKFRCSKLNGWEKGVLKAVFMVTGRHGRLFADPECQDDWGWASAPDIATVMAKEHTEENLKKIRVVLKFLRALTWVRLHYRARAGSRCGATRILVSKACFRLSKWVGDSGLKIRTIYDNHIWGSGCDSKPKALCRGLRVAAESLGISGPLIQRLAT